MRGLERAAPGGTPSLVARTSLFDRLTAGLAGGVTLVSAPAGSGKTQLLRSWIDAANLRDRTAWVSVERSEHDAQRFWLAVVGELRTAAGEGGPIEEVGPAPGFDGAVVVERIVAGASLLREPVLLVIDDLHELLEPGALAALDRLLALRPPQLRLVLATRHDPPLALHQLRLAGTLSEVRVADLRFRPDEARELLAGAGIDLSPGGLDALLDRTEGWVAGLRLAALSLAGDPDPERFVAEFSGSERTVADYLLAEVLQHQPERVRQLLVRTSILERVNGALADRLLDATGSEQILLELEEANGFVVSIDRERTWFRYHNLFADLLRLELRRTDAASVPALHRAAADWYASHKFPVEAIRHAQAADEWRLAGDLIGLHGFSLALDGSFATLRALLEPFPAEAFANPALAAFLAYGDVLRASLDTAASYIALAERHASEVDAELRQPFAAILATARLTLARWRGDHRAALQVVGPLLESSGAGSIGEIAVGNDLRAVALMSLGIVELWAGAPEDAERHLSEAAQLAARIGRPYVEQGALAHLALAVGRTSVSAGRDLAAQALAILERYGWLAEPVAPMVFATMAVCDLFQARFDEAQPWLDQAEQALPPNAEPAKEILVRYAQGMQHLGQGRLTEAVAAFAETQRLQSAMVDPDPLVLSARALLAQTFVRLGDLPAARAAQATVSATEPDYAEERAAVAAIHLAAGDAASATQALEPVIAGTRPAIIHPAAVINALLVDALAREALGDGAGAEADIERALDLAEADALIFPFLVTPAGQLLERHPRHRTAHAALLASILDVLSGASLPAPGGLDEPLEPLTESEIRVLRYLPGNLSAPEIAAEVFLSTSTVKTHMRHIYEKLGAHKRSEAVEVARRIGLLGPSARSRR